MNEYDATKKYKCTQTSSQARADSVCYAPAMSKQQKKAAAALKRKTVHLYGIVGNIHKNDKRILFDEIVSVAQAECLVDDTVCDALFRSRSLSVCCSFFCCSNIETKRMTEKNYLVVFVSLRFLLPIYYISLVFVLSHFLYRLNFL